MEEYRAALEYLKTLLTESKLLRKKIGETADKEKLWESRRALALKKGERELEKYAEKMSGEMGKERQELEAEEKNTGRLIEEAKKELERLERLRHIRLDPEKLLSRIENLTGSRADDYYLEAELERLKKEMEP